MNFEPLANWLAHTAIASTSILATGLLAVAALRRSSAALRHLICATALAASLIYSIALALPEWALPILPPEALSASPANPFTSPLPAQPSVLPAAANQISSSRNTAPVPNLKSTLVIIWLLGASLCSLRLLAGLISLRQVKKFRSFEPTDLPPTSIARRVRFLVAETEIPLTYGFLRPKILVPKIFEQWPEPTRRAVLLHELAHIQRCDWAVQILAQIARALLWFNPLAWIAHHRLTTEQERAADNLVLSHFQPASYAEALLQCAQSLSSTAERFKPLPALPILRRGSLESRLTALLDSTIHRDSISFLHTALASVALLISGLFATVQLTARETQLTSPPANQSRLLSELEQRFVGEWSGGGLFPTYMKFRDDGTYEQKSVIDQSASTGTWRAEDNLLTYSQRRPTNAPDRQRRILQVKPDFFQWQVVGEDSRNIFAYHRITNQNTAAIKGRILRKGSPLPNTPVLLEHYQPGSAPQQLREILTDAQGRFELTGLPSGNYKISRSIRWTAETSEGSSPTASWTHGQLLTLQPNQTAELLLGSGRHIKGTLTAPSEAPPLAFTAGDFRFVTPRQRAQGHPSIVYVLEIASDGTFELPDLPPGEYNLFVKTRPYNGPLDAEHTAELSHNFTVPPGTTALNLGNLPLINTPHL